MQLTQRASRCSLCLFWAVDSLSLTGSTVSTIARDGPNSARGRDKHPDELLRSSGAALRSSVPVQASDHAQVKVLSELVPGRRLLNQAGSAVPVTAQDGHGFERGTDIHPDELLQSSGAALRSSVPIRSKPENRVGLHLISGRVVVEAVKTDKDTHDTMCMCMYMHMRMSFPAEYSFISHFRRSALGLGLGLGLGFWG